MDESRIEPGLLPVFRLFTALRLGAAVLTFCAQTRPRAPHLQRYPGPMLLESSLLLLLLAWPWPRQKLGKRFLPLALLIASAGPVSEHALTVALRVANGANRLQSGADAWMLIVVLFVPLVLTAWQYGFQRALLYTTGIGLLELVIAVPLAFIGPRWITTFGLVLAQSILFVVAGYLIARLVAAQRVQRDELARANAQIKQYATTIERLTVSHERNRMARELHDTLAHTLSAVAVQLEAAEALWDQNPGAARRAMNEAQKLTHNGLQETRRALHDLRAKPLEDLGLALAVRQLAEQGSKRAGLALTAQIDPRLGTLPPEIEQSVYRVAEEAITNVVRHANAHALAVDLHRANGSVILAVRDDGRGFDSSGPRETGHYGLSGMQERAGLCGGVLDVASQPGRGTTVRLTVGVNA